MATCRNIVIVVFILILFTDKTDESRLRMKVISVQPCTSLESKKDPYDPIINLVVTVRTIDKDTTVIDCNITSKRFGPVLISLRAYQLTPGKRNMIFKADKVSCKNPMTFKLIKLFNVEMEEGCIAPPGYYHFENLNINSFAWILTKSVTGPGRYGYELEFGTPKGYVSCYYAIVNVFVKKT